jgi:hypothetical protein
MNLKNRYFMHKRTLWPLAALLSLFSIAFVLGQAPDKKPVAVVTIDGAAGGGQVRNPQGMRQVILLIHR